METKKALASGLFALTLTVAACSKSAPPPPPPANKPAAAATAPANNAAKKDTTKVTKPGEKPPESKGIPEGKRVEVPADWVTVYDENRGYEFQVPDGTQDEWLSVGTTDIYLAKLPSPAKVEVLVFAYKDEDTDKDAVLTTAKNTLIEIGEKDVKFSDTKEELNEDYYLVEFTSTDKAGVKTKGKLLVGLDKTDNFLMFVASPEADYKNNEKIIDEVWSSFGMLSGGLSGN